VIRAIFFDLGGTLKESGKWIWLPGAEEVVAELAKKYLVYVGGNQPVACREFIASSPLATNLTDIFLSEEIGLKKPQQEFYKYFLNKTSLDATEIIYVGDDYENDILGPTKLGIKTIWITSTGGDLELDLPEGALKISRLSELLGCL